MLAPPISAEAQSLLALGESLTDRGDYSAAEIAFRQILISPDSTTVEQKAALIGYARMFRRQGTHTKAAAIYEKYLKDYPDDAHVPDVLLDLGRTLRAMGAHRLAVSRFYSVINSTLKLPPHGFDHYQLLAKTAQFEIAETYFESGNFAEAEKFFARLRLLDLAPVDRARAHFKSGYAAVLGGELDQAVKIMRLFLEQWPRDENVPEARYLLATSLRQLRRVDEALAVTLELLRNQQAQSDADPRKWAYWQRRTGNQLANEFFHIGETSHALAIYQGLVALADDPAWRLPVLYQIALCYERLRTLDRARETYQAIVDGAKAGTNAELNELAKMAAWRMNNMSWNDKTERQLTEFFSTAENSDPKPAPPPATPHDASASPAAPPKAL
ncbi:MAG: tetratricopeptide repeat protein [Candidatus Didemnitutus sp.]|nr:tetratricopeptide repeat protein [Candidatus Didemnitutus sp.]